MIGVVIPAHNEEALLAHCLAAIRAAACDPALVGEAVRTVVVLDDCTDRTAEIARHGGVETLALQARNVGVARAAGAQRLLEAGARWLAFTDADSRVSPGWLAAQLSLGADAVCGSICVDDWTAHSPDLRDYFRRTYRDADGHRHVHGANLGVSAEAYRRAGGFAPLACSEDVALVEQLLATGAQIAWSAAPRVTTSARRASRARGGFGDTLRAWAAHLALERAPDPAAAERDHEPVFAPGLDTALDP
ncbi:glycosyltransferase [Paraburkholderia phenazinium]|jgi:glycosyltransferase involved in cell wall biosynthesis|uniref:Glycosyl transferase family 2 n=1 Tax=Paraburkholderia phenazinium TaxID=60549 RepID=A0A1N6KQC5_9BURK|nr:glycosyltransferase [Paraburkholderia phenazinium]SIO58749.1 Glycosyl transferase family 2 [Paraburkholderia phenazinium]